MRDTAVQSFLGGGGGFLLNTDAIYLLFMQIPILCFNFKQIPTKVHFISWSQDIFL